MKQINDEKLMMLTRWLLGFAFEREWPSTRVRTATRNTLAVVHQLGRHPSWYKACWSSGCPARSKVYYREESVAIMVQKHSTNASKFSAIRIIHPTYLTAHSHPVAPCLPTTPDWLLLQYLREKACLQPHTLLPLSQYRHLR